MKSHVGMTEQRVQYVDSQTDVDEEEVVGIGGELGVKGRAKCGVCGRGKGGADVDEGARDGGCAQSGAQEAHVLDLVVGDLLGVVLCTDMGKPSGPSYKGYLRHAIYPQPMKAY